MASPKSPSTQHNQNKFVRVGRDHTLGLYQGRAYEKENYQKIKKEHAQLAAS